MSVGQPRFAASRWNRLREEGVKMFEHVKEICLDELLVEGLPPYQVENSESDEYHKLVTASLSGDPRYHTNPEAKARLAELALRYGQPPDYPIPIGQTFPNNPAGEAAAMS